MKYVFKYLFFVLLYAVWMPFNLYGQAFTWQLSLPEVTADGYYDIVLPKEISGKSSNNLEDIRLFDSLNNEVPFVLRTTEAKSEDAYRRKLSLYKNEAQTSEDNTLLIINNKDNLNVENLILEVGSFDGAGRLSLSAGNDLQHWETLLDEYEFQTMPYYTANMIIYIVDFEKTQYKYFKVLIDGSQNKLIQVSSVSTILSEGLLADTYDEMPVKQISADSSAPSKHSYWRIELLENADIDFVLFDFDNSYFFARDARFSYLVKPKGKLDKKPYFEEIENFKVRSYGRNEIDLYSVNASVFLLDVDNNDDAPLQLNRVRLYQRKHYLRTKLTAGNKYFVKVGDPKLGSAYYDFSDIAYSLPDSLPVLLVSADTLTKIEKKKIEEDSTQALIMWGILIVVIIFVGVISVKMLTQVSDKKEV